MSRGAAVAATWIFHGDKSGPSVPRQRKQHAGAAKTIESGSSRPQVRGRPDVAAWAMAHCGKWGVEADASAKAYVARLEAAALRPDAARRALGDAPEAEPLVWIARAQALLGQRDAAISTCAEVDALLDAGAGEAPRQGRRDDATRDASNAHFRRHRGDEARRDAALVREASSDASAEATVGVLSRVVVVGDAMETSAAHAAALAKGFGLEEALWAEARSALPGDDPGREPNGAFETRVLASVFLNVPATFWRHSGIDRCAACVPEQFQPKTWATLERLVPAQATAAR